MKKVQILLVILVTLMVSCSKDDIKIDPDNLVLGCLELYILPG